MSKPHAPRRVLVLLTASLLLFAAWLVGQLFRDRWWLTGLAFYIPSPLMTAALVAAALILWRRRRRDRAAVALALAAAPLVWTVVLENAPAGQPEADPGALRLVHWNVGGRLGPESRTLLQSLNAQLYVLSEAPTDGSVQQFAADLGNAYRLHSFGNLAVVGRGSPTGVELLVNRRRTKVASLTWQVDSASVRLMVVDLPSEIQVHREPLLREVIGLVAVDEPDLVVGDFNAPRRSRRLADLPAGYCHAYDAAGRGWGYTWPVPVPVYAIDQCIFGPRIAPGPYYLISSRHSDHRIQVFDFDLRPPRSGP